jgi:vanillate O-demethylase monooxygenase subunit
VSTDRANELDVVGEAAVYRSFRHFWHPVLHARDLESLPVRAELCGEAVVLVRLEGEVCAFRDLCAHRGTALSLGEVEDDSLRCAYHGWRYDRHGTCVHAPQRPDLAASLKARLRKYRAQERYGFVWVCLVDEPRLPIPDFPQFDDPALGLRHEHVPCTDWECSAPRRTENFTDLSHFSVVHDGVLGARDRPEVPRHHVWREGDALHMQLANDDAPSDLRMTWQIFMPLTVVWHGHNVTRDWHETLFFHPTPIGPKRTRNFLIDSVSFMGEEWHEIARAFQDVVNEQDRPVVESQRPEELPEDLAAEMHLKNVDTYSLHYRKWLLELARELGGPE